MDYAAPYSRYLHLGTCASAIALKPATDTSSNGGRVVNNDFSDFSMKNGTYRLVLEYRRTKVPPVLQSTSMSMGSCTVDSPVVRT